MRPKLVKLNTSIFLRLKAKFLWNNGFRPKPCLWHIMIKKHLCQLFVKLGIFVIQLAKIVLKLVMSLAIMCHFSTTSHRNSFTTYLIPSVPRPRFVITHQGTYAVLFFVTGSRSEFTPLSQMREKSSPCGAKLLSWRIPPTIYLTLLS